MKLVPAIVTVTSLLPAAALAGKTDATVAPLAGADDDVVTDEVEATGAIPEPPQLESVRTKATINVKQIVRYMSSSPNLREPPGGASVRDQKQESPFGPYICDVVGNNRPARVDRHLP
jgi:hypothetical protein